MSYVMASVAMPSTGSPVRITYFPEELPGGDAIRLAAAVVWRGEPHRARARLRAPGPLGWLRRLRHRLWMRFGPPGLDVHLRWSRRATMSSGGASFGEDGEDATFYDARRREVRVLGRGFPLPPEGQALVLLVDHGDSVRDGPRVTPRSVPTAVRPSVHPRHFADPNSQASAARHAEAMSADSAAWLAVLRAHPEVRRVLEEAGMF